MFFIKTSEKGDNTGGTLAIDKCSTCGVLIDSLFAVKIKTKRGTLHSTYCVTHKPSYDIAEFGGLYTDPKFYKYVEVDVHGAEIKQTKK